MSWQDIPFGAVPHAVMSALGVGSEPFYHEAGVGSAWWRGNRAGDFQKWLEGEPIDFFAPHRLEDTRLHALPSRFNPQNQHFDASLASNAPINLFAPHSLQDTRLHGEPEGLGISIPSGSLRVPQAAVSHSGTGFDFENCTSWKKISAITGTAPGTPGLNRTELTMQYPAGFSPAILAMIRQEWGQNWGQPFANGRWSGSVMVTYYAGPHTQILIEDMANGRKFALECTENFAATSFAVPANRHYATYATRFSGNPTGLAAAFVIATGNYASVGPAADGLATRINTGGGCSTSSISECVDFQTAWNAAGGTPSLVVDGLYGTNTASALNDALLNGTNQPPQATPAACTFPTPVTPAPTTPVTPPPASTSTTNWTPWIIGGVVAAGALGGLYMYKKKHGRMPRMRHA
jgi:hypothetical protein